VPGRKVAACCLHEAAAATVSTGDDGLTTTGPMEADNGYFSDITPASVTQVVAPWE